MPYWLNDPLVLLGASGPLDISTEDPVDQLNSLMILTIIVTFLILVIGGNWVLFFIVSVCLNIGFYTLYALSPKDEYLTKGSIGLEEHKVTFVKEKKFTRSRL